MTKEQVEALRLQIRVLTLERDAARAEAAALREQLQRALRAVAVCSCDYGNAYAVCDIHGPS